MSVWDWFHEFERDARRQGDRDRLRLLQYYNQGYQLREKDPDRAFALYSEARQLAQRLGEPWMALFYDEWRVAALLHFKRDYRTVLDLAVAGALEARKPPYEHYPGRLSLFDNLIAAYLGIDPGGHADALRQALDYVDREAPREPHSARYLLLARRRIFAQELDRPDEALEEALRELELADADGDRARAEHFQAFVYCALCEIAHARGEWDPLREWSAAGDAVARRVGHQVELSELLAWRAVTAARDGDRDRALRLARSAAARMRAQRMPPTRGFYDALCAYHELEGDREGMLAVRDRELRDVSGWGRFLAEARCRLQRLRLLARMGRPPDTEAAAAREAALRLQQPEVYLAEIERIAASPGERGVSAP
jgi:hypothetical protein